MFCSKTIYKMIETIQKRALTALCKTCDMALDDFLAKDGFPVNIRALLAEIFKTVHGFNPSFMKEIFISKVVSYSLRDTDLLVFLESNTVRYGINSLAFRSGILWNSLPSCLKKAKTLHAFKDSMHTCNIFEYTCSLCKS